jgi:hypothetical protein
MKPRIGGASRNVTNEVWASAATLTAAGLSVRCAAADMASGKMAEEPTPSSAKPSRTSHSALPK